MIEWATWLNGLPAGVRTAFLAASLFASAGVLVACASAVFTAYDNYIDRRDKDLCLIDQEVRASDFVAICLFTALLTAASPVAYYFARGLYLVFSIGLNGGPK